MLIHRTTRSTLDLALILDLNMYATPSAPINNFTLAPFALPSASASHTPSGSAHANDITSISIPLSPYSLASTDFTTGPFYTLIRDLLWEGRLPDSPAPPADQEFDILRSKGFFRTAAPELRPYVMQGVRELFAITELPLEADEGGQVEPKLVLIGRGLNAGVKQRFLNELEKAWSTRQL